MAESSELVRLMDTFLCRICAAAVMQTLATNSSSSTVYTSSVNSTRRTAAKRIFSTHNYRYLCNILQSSFVMSIIVVSGDSVIISSLAVKRRSITVSSFSTKSSETISTVKQCSAKDDEENVIVVSGSTTSSLSAPNNKHTLSFSPFLKAHTFSRDIHSNGDVNLSSKDHTHWYVPITLTDGVTFFFKAHSHTFSVWWELFDT